MKRLTLKLMLTILTFFIGVGAVSLWYLSHLYSETQQSFSDVVSSIPPVKFTVENPCDYPKPKYRELEAQEAVYLAECFIIQNGYTDLPPIANKSKLTPENVFPLIDEEGLKMRHNSLERKSYSIERANESWGGSWIVVFRYKSRCNSADFYNGESNEWGRAVIMDIFGRRLRVKHTDYPLSSPHLPDLRKIIR
jgi:hypothetical protein